MPEQLSLDFSDAVTAEPDAAYEALDYQLAELLQRLNGEADPALEKCALLISKHTREGQIAISCRPDQQATLFKTAVTGGAGDYKPLIIDRGFLYLNRYWRYQQRLAEQIKARMAKRSPLHKHDEMRERLDYYFGAIKAAGEKKDAPEKVQEKAQLKTTETDWQKHAAQRALENKLLILSGGPGTGKTTTITRILALLIEQHHRQYDSEKPLRILLAAPTGKAAIRMIDSIHHELHKLERVETDAHILAQMPAHASTLHRLLGFIPQSASFKHNADHPLNADVVLVDEASMIDLALMSKLFEAVPENARLILIGDKDQLDSVETGSVFADICKGLETGQHLATLKKNWRFSSDSGIGRLAVAANQGDADNALAILHDKNKPECALLTPDILSANQNPATAPDNLARLFSEPWEPYFELLNNPDASLDELFAAFNHYRILCALRRGLNGSLSISRRIEDELQRRGLIQRREPGRTGQHWYHGRPVMITRNSHSKGLANGDTGITLIDQAGRKRVWFPDAGRTTDSAYKAFAPVRLPAHETSWAMTIHKSQGSEFDQVALILPHEIMPLLSRQLIYTGVTRAREKVSLVAREDVLRAGIKSRALQATQIESIIA